MPNQKPAISGLAKIEQFEKPHYTRRTYSKAKSENNVNVPKTHTCDVMFAVNSVRRNKFVDIDDIGEWLEKDGYQYYATVGEYYIWNMR